MLKVVSIPDNDRFYPPEITEKIRKLDTYKEKLLRPIDEHLESLLDDRRDELETELTGIKKLDTITSKNNEIREDLEQLVTDDDDIKSKVTTFANTIDELLSNNPANLHVDSPDKIDEKGLGGYLR